MKVKIVIWFFFHIAPTVLFACPLCATNTAMEVRANIFDHHFLFSLFVLFLPFIICLFIAFAIHYEPGNCHKKKSSNTSL